MSALLQLADDFVDVKDTHMYQGFIGGGGGGGGAPE